MRLAVREAVWSAGLPCIVWNHRVTHTDLLSLSLHLHLRSLCAM
mgnify:CR=1 FL=1